MKYYWNSAHECFAINLIICKGKKGNQEGGKHFGILLFLCISVLLFCFVTEWRWLWPALSVSLPSFALQTHELFCFWISKYVEKQWIRVFQGVMYKEHSKYFGTFTINEWILIPSSSSLELHGVFPVALVCFLLCARKDNNPNSVLLK